MIMRSVAYGMVLEKHAYLEVGASRSRLHRCRTGSTQQKVTFERCLMDVNWPSRRGGLAIFVRDAAPSAREEYEAREEAIYGG